MAKLPFIVKRPKWKAQRRRKASPKSSHARTETVSRIQPNRIESSLVELNRKPFHSASVQSVVILNAHSTEGGGGKSVGRRNRICFGAGCEKSTTNNTKQAVRAVRQSGIGGNPKTTDNLAISSTKGGPRIYLVYIIMVSVRRVRRAVISFCSFVSAYCLIYFYLFVARVSFTLN